MIDDEPVPPLNIVIAFYLRDGSVEKLARAIAQGADWSGATVRLRRARELVGEPTCSERARRAQSGAAAWLFAQANA